MLIQADDQGPSGFTGQSGLITVTSASPHHLIKVSLEDSITVGTTRLIEVRAEDEFDNPAQEQNA